jgi:prevent-host-death family protein
MSCSLEATVIDLKEIYSLSGFQRNAKSHLERMKETKTPVVLTVNGKAELVVQDAASYQELLERIERAETGASVRQAMEEFDRGEGRPAREALEELRDKYVIPR